MDTQQNQSLIERESNRMKRNRCIYASRTLNTGQFQTFQNWPEVRYFKVQSSTYPEASRPVRSEVQQQHSGNLLVVRVRRSSHCCKFNRSARCTQCAHSIALHSMPNICLQLQHGLCLISTANTAARLGQQQQTNAPERVFPASFFCIPTEEGEILFHFCTVCTRVESNLISFTLVRQ